MARRKRVYAKPEYRDPRYDSPLVALLVNKIMMRGKKSLAERIVYSAIEKVNEKGEAVDPLELVTRAIENAKPEHTQRQSNDAEPQASSEKEK